VPVLLAAEAHRRDVATLVSLARNDLRLLLAPLDTAEAVRDALLLSLPDLVDLYGSAAATLAADWYEDLRADEEIRGRFTATPATLPDAGRSEALARWAVDPMFTADPDKLKALERASGGLQRIIANGSRETIAGSSIDDLKANGWQRTGRGACGFCAMLISRGSVYTESSAAFASHDHCNCSAVPAFDGLPRPVQPYTPSLRQASKADRARVRDYLATH
jgi:hypothetical protein